MPNSSVLEIVGQMVPVPGNDIDTDRIIPARFMTAITFDGLGNFAFYDERFDREGKQKKHPFNDPCFAGHQILVTQKNFGCGSSREHAPQSLMRWGIRALIGESFADIFAGNCAANGVPAVMMSAQDVSILLTIAQQQPELVIRIDLNEMTVSAGEVELHCSMPEAARRSLINGTWDMTTVLMESVEKIRTTASRLPYMNGFVKA